MLSYRIAIFSILSVTLFVILNLDAYSSGRGIGYVISGLAGWSGFLVLTGNIVGVTCTFLGTVSVHASGNVYDLSVTFDGNPECDLGTQTVTGIAVFDDSDDQLIAAAINAARNDGFVYLGEKLSL